MPRPHEFYTQKPAGHCRGGGMPRCAEFHTQKPAGQKASPGGEAGATSVATDEVEAVDYHHRLVRRCYLRPHPVRLGPDHHSRGMTATGSHIDFGFAARSTTLQGKALDGASSKVPTAPHPAALRPPSPRGRRFLGPGGLLRRFISLGYCQPAGGACRRPYKRNRVPASRGSALPRSWLAP